LYLFFLSYSFEELDSITNELHAVDLQIRELLEKQRGHSEKEHPNKPNKAAFRGF